MIGFLILAVGIVIGFEAPIWLSMAIKYFENRQILKEITPTDVKENKLCKGPHAWLEVPLFLDSGKPGKTQVCRVCGLFPSLNKMATPEAIDRIEENNMIRGLEERIYRDFLAQEDKDIRAYFGEEITKGVSFDKLAHIHGAGMTFSARFKQYRLSRADEITKALKRTDA